MKNYKVKTPFLNVSPAVVNRYYIYGLPRQKSDRFLAFDSKTVGEKKGRKAKKIRSAGVLHMTQNDASGFLGLFVSNHSMNRSRLGRLGMHTT